MKKDRVYKELDKKYDFENDPREIIAYVRVSTKDQEKGYSIEAQKQTIEEFAKFNNLTISRFYIESKSAWSIGAIRKEYDRLVQDIKDNKIKGILAWKSDRLNRRNERTEEMLSLMVEYKIKLITVTEGVSDYTTADGRKNIRQRGIDNQHESEKTSERVKWTTRGSARSGNYPFPYVPLGYKRADLGYKSAPLEIDEEIAGEIRNIFILVEKNKWGIKTLLNYLNSNNVLDRRWHEKSLYNLIHNPIYKGDLQIPLHNPNYIIENHSPAIVERELWDEVQKIIGNRIYDKKYKYEYKSFVYCESDNHKMTCTSTINKNGNAYLYYYCSKCKKRINEKKLKSMITDKLNIKYLEQQKSCEKEVYLSYINKLQRVEQLIKQNDKWVSANVIDIDYHIEEKSKLLLKRKEYMNSLSKLRATTGLYSDLDYREKRTWLREFVKKISVDLSDMEVEVKFRKNK